MIKITRLFLIVCLCLTFIGLVGCNSERAATEQEPAAEQVEIPDRNPSGQLIDCETSDTLLDTSIAMEFIDATGDAGLQCIGEAILNGCESAYLNMNTANAGAIEMATSRGEEDICNIRLRYGSADQIPIEEQKGYAEKSVICPVSMRQFYEETGLSREQALADAANHGLSFYFYTGFLALNKDGPCSGDLVGTVDLQQVN